MQTDPQDIYCYIKSDFIVFKKTVCVSFGIYNGRNLLIKVVACVCPKEKPLPTQEGEAIWGTFPSPRRYH